MYSSNAENPISVLSPETFLAVRGGSSLKLSITVRFATLFL